MAFLEPVVMRRDAPGGRPRAKNHDGSYDLPIHKETLCCNVNDFTPPTFAF